MFNISKQPQKLANFCHLLVNRNQKLLNIVNPYVLFINYSSQVKLYGNVQSRDLLLSDARYRIIVSREKSRAKKAYGKHDNTEDDSDDDDDDEENEEEYVEDGAIVKTYNLSSLRIDLILKQVHKQKRRKIEEFFYGNKIRVNGKVLLKKAMAGHIGDEIDIIEGISKNNSELIEVARIEILDVKNDDGQRFLLKVKQYKRLEIDNYPDGDTWNETDAKA